ncbi:hypothetical protein [Burkholderia sp. BCC0419]|uniref:hypothetical protein n=1 Tax=Burkholderia sp. BCC0419 TaxID=486878 RepID=UPI00158ECE19|nr:hypothetical protein [Burkholderia sp. BCC0419]
MRMLRCQTTLPSPDDDRQYITPTVTNLTALAEIAPADAQGNTLQIAFAPVSDRTPMGKLRSYASLQWPTVAVTAAGSRNSTATAQELKGRHENREQTISMYGYRVK